MGSAPKMPAVREAEKPVEKIDLNASTDLEKSLLKRRKGLRSSFLTKGQATRKPSNTTPNKLGGESTGV